MSDTDTKVLDTPSLNDSTFVEKTTPVEASATAHKDVFAKCREFTEPQQVQQLGLYPYFRTIEATLGNQVICGGRRKIMIGSNNYLGLANDERVLESAQAAVRKYGSGCTGS